MLCNRLENTVKLPVEGDEKRFSKYLSHLDIVSQVETVGAPRGATDDEIIARAGAAPLHRANDSLLLSCLEITAARCAEVYNCGHGCTW